MEIEGSAIGKVGTIGHLASLTLAAIEPVDHISLLEPTG
jgi:hypothetical protein